MNIVFITLKKIAENKNKVFALHEKTLYII